MKCKNFLCYEFNKNMALNCNEYGVFTIGECKSRKLFNKIFHSKIYTIDCAYDQYKKGAL